MSASDAHGWAKLHAGFERTIARVIDDHGVVAVGYWAMMLVEARRGEEVEFGHIDTTARSFARLVGDTKARPSLWQSFVDHELLTLVRGDLRRGFTVRMHEEYFDTQSPKGSSSAERMKKLRERRRSGNPASERGGVTDRPSQRDAGVTPRDADVTGRDEDLRLETEDLAPSGASPKPRQARISALTGEQVEQQIAACRETLNGLHPLVDQLVDAMADENKTGRVAAKRVLRELWIPIAALTEETDRSALRHGLEQAVAKGAPNVNYIKKAAASYRPNTRPTARGGDIIEGANDGRQQQPQYARADLTWD